MVMQKILLDNGETISYRERYGGEQVLVLVHGNMTSSQHWDVLIDALDPKYKLYALDLRGFGESSYHTRIQGIADFAADLRGFVDALGLETFHLVGWSTGGVICMQFVADNPGYCEKLVLLPLQLVGIHSPGRRQMEHPICKLVFNLSKKWKMMQEKQKPYKDYMIRKTVKD